jgi:hypothetical protein
MHNDTRLAPTSLVHEGGDLKGQNKSFSDVWLNRFNYDFRIDPNDFLRQTWCTNAPWPQENYVIGSVADREL